MNICAVYTSCVMHKTSVYGRSQKPINLFCDLNHHTKSVDSAIRTFNIRLVGAKYIVISLTFIRTGFVILGTFFLEVAS